MHVWLYGFKTYHSINQEHILILFSHLQQNLGAEQSADL